MAKVFTDNNAKYHKIYLSQYNKPKLKRLENSRKQSDRPLSSAGERSNTKRMKRNGTETVIEINEFKCLFKKLVPDLIFYTGGKSLSLGSSGYNLFLINIGASTGILE